MRIEVVAERRWGVSAAWVRRILAVGWRHVPGRRSSLALSVALVGRAMSAKLNARYRRTPGPTNILSFPLASSSDRTGLLGEIILCVPVVRAEAKRYGRPFRQQAALLLLHGLLHLHGYDHRQPSERQRMERLEHRLLTMIPHLNA